MFESLEGRNLQTLLRAQVQAGRVSASEAGRVLASFLEAAPALRLMARNRAPQSWRALSAERPFKSAYQRWIRFLEANGALFQTDANSNNGIGIIALESPISPYQSSFAYDPFGEILCCSIKKFRYPRTLKAANWPHPQSIPGIRGMIPRYLVGFAFTADAEFGADDMCACSCCEFRQNFASIGIYNIEGIDPRLAGRATNPSTVDNLREDGIGTARYGHRDGPVWWPDNSDRDAAVPDGYFESPKHAEAATKKLDSLGACGQSNQLVRSSLNPEGMANVTEDQLTRAGFELKSLEGKYDKEAKAKSTHVAGSRVPSPTGPHMAGSRGGGCYYFLSDIPRFSLLQGMKVWNVWYFEGNIVTQCGNKEGKYRDAFMVGVEADWTGKHQLKPELKYVFWGLGIEAQMQPGCGKKVSEAEFERSVRNAEAFTIGKRILAGPELWSQMIGRFIGQYKGKLGAKVAPPIPRPAGK